MVDFAVVGSGIGGSCSALMLSKNFSVTLFEKDANLGGCSSTFKRHKNFYNTAATTFAGFKKGHVVYDFFDTHNLSINSKPLDSALTVIQNNNKIKRHKDLDRFCNEINNAHYHKKNSDFYRLIHQINEEFYIINGYYYSNKSLYAKTKSLFSYIELFKKFKSYLFIDAKSFIMSYFGGISTQYLDFLDNQLLIVAQAKTHEVNFLTAALALGYQFQDNHYIYGGMGELFKLFTSDIDAHIKSEIVQIDKHQNHYTLHTKKNSFRAKNIVLNSTIFDSYKLFSNKKINSYFEKYKYLDSHYSAFMLYLQIDTDKEFDHHYQVIENKNFPFTISNSIFISFGDKEDEKMKNSVTISIHVNKDEWEDDYERKKELLENEIIDCIQTHLGLLKSEITRYFSAKPHTYKRYINRCTLGGIPMAQKNLIYKLPGNDTPIKGLYMIGDTTYAAQGWPGVLMGVKNLERLVCKS